MPTSGLPTGGEELGLLERPFFFNRFAQQPIRLRLWPHVLPVQNTQWLRIIPLLRRKGCLLWEVSGIRAGRSSPCQKNFFGAAPFFSTGLCYSMWLFHLHSALKIQPFYPVFPLAGSTDKAFCRLSLWNFREKNINYFLQHSLPQRVNERLCPRKQLMFYFLKFQRNSQ